MKLTEIENTVILYDVYCGDDIVDHCFEYNGKKYFFSSGIEVATSPWLNKLNLPEKISYIIPDGEDGLFIEIVYCQYLFETVTIYKAE